MRTAFVLAVFGWGIGFYGPPIFLHAVMQRTGWPLALVSAAVTLHFLIGAAVVAALPRLHARFGIAAVTAAGAAVLALGVSGWARAVQPWMLFAAALATGSGWVTLGAAAINAMVSPWYAQGRPMALAKAYNGASVGGVVFSPLWVAAIALWGFGGAALVVGCVLLAVAWPLAARVLTRTPANTGQAPDGVVVARGAATAGSVASDGRGRWSDRAFLSLALAMALGLFAQIGLLAHLYALLTPVLGPQGAGWVMALATGCGLAGRMVLAQLLRPGMNRRVAAIASYALQAVGTVLLLAWSGPPMAGIVAGVVLFGLGIGNATSLPPLIAQQEFQAQAVPRVVARCVALAQALYAFAPAAFALLLATAAGGPVSVLGRGTIIFLGAVLLVQLLAMGCMAAGIRRR